MECAVTMRIAAVPALQRNFFAVSSGEKAGSVGPVPVMKMYPFQFRLLAALLFPVLVLALTCRAADKQQTDGLPILAGPILQCATENSVRVTWITERDSTAMVEYGPLRGDLKSVSASHHGLIDAGERVHSVELSGLKPGTAYRYRLVSREIVNFGAYKVVFGDSVTNEFSQFHTLDRGKKEFSFLVFNDVHDQASTIPELLRIAGPEPYDLVVFNGDLVSHSDSEKPVLSILQQSGVSFAGTTPLCWVRGNHETRGSFARQLPRYMGLPDGRYYYAFDHGPVHFVVLDAGEDKLDSSPEYSGLVDFSRYRREEGEWLKAHVREKSFRKAQYRVVLCHMPFPRKMPPRARAAEEQVFMGMPEAYAQFGPTLEKAGVDLMISGHVHAAAVIPPEPPRHSYPIVQGGGNKGDGRTLIRVAVTSRALEAAIFKPDGSLAGSCKVKPHSR